MKAVFPSVILVSLTLAGCCTSTYPPEQTDRVYGQEWGDTSVCGIFSGWGTREQPERSEALYTPVTVDEYAKYLCSAVDIEDYATCANRLQKSYDESLENPLPYGSSTTSGPFAFVLENVLYTGSYRSDPFSASFRVSSDVTGCKGSYNALQGDTDAVFKVWCDNGQRGKARMVRDRNGRNGIGVVIMDDGAQGRLVFGPGLIEAVQSTL